MSEEEYEVEKILQHRVVNGVTKYKLKWKGYPMSECTWEDESNLDCPDLLQDYWDAKNKSSKKTKSNSRKKGADPKANEKKKETKRETTPQKISEPNSPQIAEHDDISPEQPTQEIENNQTNITDFNEPISKQDNDLSTDFAPAEKPEENSQEIIPGNSQEIIPDNSQETILGNSQEIISENSQDIILQPSNNSDEVESLQDKIDIQKPIIKEKKIPKNPTTTITVLAASKDPADGELLYLIEKNDNGRISKSVVPGDVARKNFPFALIDFFVQHLHFDTPIKV